MRSGGPFAESAPILMVRRRVDEPAAGSAAGFGALLAADGAATKPAAALLTDTELALTPALLAGTQRHEAPRLRKEKLDRTRSSVNPSRNHRRLSRSASVPDSSPTRPPRPAAASRLALPVSGSDPFVLVRGRRAVGDASPMDLLLRSLRGVGVARRHPALDHFDRGRSQSHASLASRMQSQWEQKTPAPRVPRMSHDAQSPCSRAEGATSIQAVGQASASGSQVGNRQ